MKTDTRTVGDCGECQRPMRRKTDPPQDGLAVLHTLKSGLCTACHQRAERRQRNAARKSREQFQRLTTDEGTARSAALTVCAFARGVEDARMVLDALGLVEARSTA